MGAGNAVMLRGCTKCLFTGGKAEVVEKFHLYHPTQAPLLNVKVTLWAAADAVKISKASALFSCMRSAPYIG